MDFLFAAAQPGQGGGGIAAFLPFIVILAIIYFLMIRPQTKRQKEKETMRGELKKGDKIGVVVFTTKDLAPKTVDLVAGEDIAEKDFFAKMLEKAKRSLFN